MEQLVEMILVSKSDSVTETEERVNTEIVKKAADGDKDAFTELFMKTYRYSYSVVRNYLNNDEDIYDALQDTYTKAYANLYRLKSYDSFYPWISKIAENSAKDIYSKRAPTEEDDDFLGSIAEPESSEFSKEVMMDVTAVLQLLPKEDAELLAHVYYDGFTVKEISRMQGVAATTVYSRLNAAKRRLKNMLKVKGIEKPLYGGDIAALVATSIRNAIGSNILSAAVAEEILQSILNRKDKNAVIFAAVTRKQRNAAVLRVASLVVLMVVLTSILTVGIYLSVLNFGKVGDKGTVAETSSGAGNTGGNNFWASLFGSSDDKQSSQDSSASYDNTSSDDSSADDMYFGNSSENSGVTENTSSDNSTSSLDTTTSNSTMPNTTSSNISSANTSSDSTSSSTSSSSTASKPNNDSQEEVLPDIDLTSQISNVAVFSRFGNSSNNLNTSYGGTMVRDGDWFYFTHGGSWIFRITIEGEQQLLIHDTDNDTWNLNVMDGYVLFVEKGQVMALDLDTLTSNKVSSFSKNVNNIYTVDGKIYATVGLDPNAEVWVCTIGTFNWSKVGKGYERLYFTDDGKAVYYRTTGGKNGLYKLYRYDLYNKTSALISSEVCEGDIKVLGEYVVYPGIDKRTGHNEMRLVSVYHPNKIIKTYVGNTCCYISPYKGGTVAFEMGKLYYIATNTSEVTDTRFYHSEGQVMPGDEYFYYIKEYDATSFIHYEKPNGSGGSWICPY